MDGPEDQEKGEIMAKKSSKTPMPMKSMMKPMNLMEDMPKKEHKGPMKGPKKGMK
jgi:hypothetical protein